VLAMPPPASAEVTGELAAQSPAWADMLHNVTGVPTIAAQLWFTQTLDELGWSNVRSGGDGPPLILSYATPLQAAADMTEISKHEPWLSRQAPPRSLLYLCDAMIAPPGAPHGAEPSGSYIVRSREAARKQSLGWVLESIGHLLPGLVGADGNVAWSSFASPVDASGPARFDAQYYRGNTSLSELYITTFPDTVRFRLPPGQSSFDNLYLAGDWTRNNIEIGSLEGAILSGRMAARSILGMSYSLYGERDPMPWGQHERSASGA
jgi:Flavin containing amine oxidoreductase